MEHSRLNQAGAISPGEELVNPSLHLHAVVLDSSPGETLAIPAGTPHTFEVEGDGARFVAEFRPAHRIGAFFKELFALATEGRLDRRGNPRPTDLAVLMQRYPEDFFYLPVIPPRIQRALARPLARD